MRSLARPPNESQKYCCGAVVGDARGWEGVAWDVRMGDDEQAVASIGFIGGRRGGVPPVEGEIEGEEKKQKSKLQF